MAYVQLNRKPYEAGINSLVDDIFNEFPAFFGNGFNKSVRKASVPVNVKETDKAYELELMVPGFEKTDFNVNLEQNLLTISAEKKEAVEGQEGKLIRSEYSVRSFKRSFTIDDKIDATNIEAVYINGILRLNLPKKVTVQASKAIEIK